MNPLAPPTGPSTSADGAVHLDGSGSPVTEDGVPPPPAASMLSNLAWSVSAEAVRLVGSFLAFLILVRIYEPAEFGLLMGTIALFSALFPVASLGAGWLVLQRVATEGWANRRALATATGMMIAGSAVLGLLAMAIRPLVLPQMGLLLYVGVGVSEMLLLGLTEVTLFAAQAGERLVAKTVAWSVYGFGRLFGAVVLFLTVDEPGLGAWIGVNIVVGVLVVGAAQRLTVGGMVRPTMPHWADVREGLPYSVGFGAERMLGTADQVLLVRLDFEADAGLYAAGRRLLTVSLAPVLAALQAVSARLWRAGGRSPAQARSRAVVFTTVGVVYGLLTAGGWLLFGDLVAGLLGDTYIATAPMLPWLGLIPLLTALEVFAATALTASGHHRRRIELTVLIGVANIALNLWWIPTMGWRGAVYASLVSSAAYAGLLWLTLTVVARRPRPARGEADLAQLFIETGKPDKEGQHP